MIKTVFKAVVSVVFSFMTLFIAVGYASLADELAINGEANIVPNYKEIVITNVIATSGTTGSSGSSTPIFPTSVMSTITGSSGQKIVYKITAHNFSETVSYVYTGPVYGSGFESVANKLSITAATDLTGATRLPNGANENHVSGTPVAPGEDFVFYATYTLNGSVSGGDVLVNYSFKPVIYTVTYANNNSIYAVDCVVNNSVPYPVRNDGPANGSLVFANWVNASANPVDSYPAGNTNNYTLFAKWDNVYMIVFTDERGNLLYQENFTSSATGLSSAGQARVDQIIAELQADAATKELSVKWSDYTIKGAKEDIAVRAVYTYHGNLQYTPVDRNGDGIIDYYQLDAVSTLEPITEVLGNLNGLDVEVINKLYKNEGNFDFGSGVSTIILNEGTKTLNHNSLAYTSDLDTVYLPHSLTYINKNAFSRNTSDDKKVLTIHFNGTLAEWEALRKNSHEDWHNGLRTDSRVICTDGYYSLKVTGISWLGLEKYEWTAHPN